MAKNVQYFIAALCVIITLFVLMPLDIEVFRSLSERANIVMFVFLAVGLLGLVTNAKYVMYSGMVSSALLALFLKGESNGSIVFSAENNLPKVSIFHLNLSSITDDYNAAFDRITSYNPDIISLQEVTPVWTKFLDINLSKDYPYKANLVQVDPYGKAIYSKLPIQVVDTMYAASKPMLGLDIAWVGRPLRLASSYISHAVDKSGQSDAKATLTVLTDWVNQQDIPTLAMGDFNLVYWSNDIRKFRDDTKFNNSRLTTPLSANLPYDHIFYNNKVECTDFEEVSFKQSHLGIFGKYQIAVN